MPFKMVYCCSCGETWDTSEWVDVETHLDNNPTHVVTESYAHTAFTGIPDTLPIRAPDGTVYRVNANTYGGLVAESDNGVSTKVPKAVLDASTNPTVDQDITEGYEVGSRWFNIATGEQFLCVDNTNGQAIWVTGGDLIVNLSPTILGSNASLSQTDLDAGFIPGLYKATADLPDPPSTIPGFAWINNGTRYPDLAWWQAGATGWVTSSHPYLRPPDPLGENLIDPAAAGSGNYAWTGYAMGTMFRITAAGDGRDINRVSFYQGSSGTGDHQWVLAKSTLVQVATPSINTFSNIVASGTFTVGSPDAWTDVDITDVPVAENEHYVVMKWTGTGGTSASPNTLRSAGLLNESYAVVENGVYSSGASSTPPGTVPIPPTNVVSGTLYGISSVRIK